MVSTATKREWSITIVTAIIGVYLLVSNPLDIQNWLASLVLFGYGIANNSSLINKLQIKLHLNNNRSQINQGNIQGSNVFGQVQVKGPFNVFAAPNLDGKGNITADKKEQLIKIKTSIKRLKSKYSDFRSPDMLIEDTDMDHLADLFQKTDDTIDGYQTFFSKNMNMIRMMRPFPCGDIKLLVEKLVEIIDENL